MINYADKINTPRITALGGGTNLDLKEEDINHLNFHSEQSENYVVGTGRPGPGVPNSVPLDMGWGAMLMMLLLAFAYSTYVAKKSNV